MFRIRNKLIFVALLGMIGGNFASAEDIKLSGFVDANYRWNSQGTLTPGFSVTDAALYFSKELNNAKVMVDLPFSNAGATNNNFNFATTQAQAYVSYKYDNGIEWQLGQWDYIFGYEGADSADRFFSGAGLIPTYGHFDTSTGLLVGYSFSEALMFQVYAANPNNQGLLGSDNMDYGVKGSGKMDAFSYALGYRTWKRKSNNVFDNTIDLVLGYNMGDTDLNFEVARHKNAVHSTTGMGYGLWATHNFDNDFAWGLRGEYTEKMVHKDWATNSTVTAADTIYRTAWQASTGPSFKLTKDLTGRADFTYYTEKRVPGVKAWVNKYATVSAVYKF